MDIGRIVPLRRAPLYLLLALSLSTLQHRIRDLVPPDPYDAERIGREESHPPYQRRVLVPWLQVRVSDATGAPMETVELATNVAALLGAFLVLDAWLVAIGMEAAAAAGPLLLAALIPLGFLHDAPEAYVALLVVAAGCLLLERERDAWLVPLVLVGTLVRETAVLLPAVFALAAWHRLPRRRWVGLLVAMTAAFVVARVALATRYPGASFESTIAINASYLLGDGVVKGALRWAVLLLPLGLAAPALRDPRPVVRAAAAVGVAYAVALFPVGRYHEARIFYESWLLLTPAILASVFGLRARSRTP